MRFATYRIAQLSIGFRCLGLDKHILGINCKQFSYPSVKTFVVGSQKNNPYTVLLITNNIYFICEIRKIIFN